MKIPAKIISVVFHPLFFTTYAVLLMFALPGFLNLYPYNYKKAITLIVFTATFILPLLVLLILLNLQKIQNLQFADKKERLLPLFTTFILYISAYLITTNFPGGIPTYISIFILCSVISVLLITIITYKFKISIHMAGIGGFIGFFYIFFLEQNMPSLLFTIGNFQIYKVHFFTIMILVSGIIASSRLKLNAHNPLQITTGFFLGLFTGLLSLVFY